MCLNIVVFQNGIICLSETLAIAPLDEFNIWKRGYVSMTEKLYVYMRCSHNRFILLGQGSHRQSLPPPKRATWDLVEEVENQVALNFWHSNTDLDAGLEGQERDERFLLSQLTLAGMEPGTPLSPQATLGPSSSWRVSPLNKLWGGFMRKPKASLKACC